MRVAAPARSRGILPLAAICCLGILLLLIAATIVLALIPIYLPTKRATVVHNSNNSNIFYLQYSANADPATSQSGTLTNTGQIANTLGFGNDAEVLQGFVKATNTRRKRNLFNRRQKRAPQLGVALQCRYNMKPSCNTPACQSHFKNNFNTRIQQHGNINNFPCSILTAGVVTTVTITATFVDIITTDFATAIVGYGAVNSLIFVAIQSGDFFSPSTWLGGVVPFAKCSVVISAGIIVSIARAALTFPLEKIDVFGELDCGAGSSSFQFDYASIIVVHSGGVCHDLTSSKHFLFPGDSLITVYSGGSFGLVGTVIQTYSSAGPGKSITIPSPSGPFTCGVLPGGSVVSFPRITFIVIQSGGFTSGGTYLGGVPPSDDVCSGGCGIYVPPGVTLSTADLNGQLTIDIVEIDVAVGGALDLGTGGSNSGFKFKHGLQINVLGTLSFICSGGGISIPGGSGINFFGGGSFTSVVITFIQVFDQVTGANIGPQVTLVTGLVGPYFITISVTGTVSISITSPGGSTITSSIGTSTIGSSSTSSLSTSTSTSSTSTSTSTTSRSNSTSTTSPSNSTSTTSTSTTSTSTTSTSTTSTTTTTTTTTTTSTSTTSTSTTSTTTTTTTTSTSTSTTSTTTTSTTTTTTTTTSTSTSTTSTSTSTSTTTTTTTTTA